MVFPPFTAKFIKEGIAQNIASYVLLHKSQQNVINLTNFGPNQLRYQIQDYFHLVKYNICACIPLRFCGYWQMNNGTYSKPRFSFHCFSFSSSLFLHNGGNRGTCYLPILILFPKLLCFFNVNLNLSLRNLHGHSHWSAIN